MLGYEPILKILSDPRRNIVMCRQNDVDNKNSTLFTETLELVANNNVLNMNVTNREYYTSVVFDEVEDATNFKASVNANASVF